MRQGLSVGLTTRFVLVTVCAWLPMLYLAFAGDVSEVVAPTLGLSLSIGVLGSFLVTRQLNRSLNRLQRSTEIFALGNLDHKVYPTKIPQLVGLVAGLNEMGAQLKARVDALVRLTHEQDAILRSMVEGVITVDSSGRIMRVNEAAEELLGITVSHVAGRTVPEVVRHAEVQRFMTEASKRKGVSTETLSVWSSTEQTFLEVTASPLASHHEDSTGTLLVFHDVTRLRKLEEVRRDFVANVSHELKTPITSIKGFVETLLDGAMNEPEENRKFLGIIGRHSERLNTIFNDLLTLSRLEVEGGDSKIEFAENDVDLIVSGAVETCSAKASAKEISVEVHYEEGLRAEVNASLLEQAVVNLLDNAIKYTDHGGVVRVESLIDGDSLRISVKDTGCGIAKDHLPRLFERFYRVDQGRSRKMGGTGLGLAIVKHIAQVHGGSVLVESVVGVGSTFSLVVKGRRLGDTLYAVGE